MVFDVSVALTWILFLALFPMAFFWFRRAWRIVVKRDFSEVALKRGLPPPNPEKYAPFEMIINLISGTVVTVVIVSVALGQLDYNTWTAIAGSTIWCKFFLSFALSRQAHGSIAKPKAEPKAEPKA
jgi:small-conductance mechanosensitive channel